MFTCFGWRNQNKSSFGLVKQDSYVVCAKRDKISRYTDIERKNKVERTSRMRSGNQMWGNFSNRIANNYAHVWGKRGPYRGPAKTPAMIGTSKDDPPSVVDRGIFVSEIVIFSGC